MIVELSPNLIRFNAPRKHFHSGKQFTEFNNKTEPDLVYLYLVMK